MIRIVYTCLFVLFALVLGAQQRTDDGWRVDPERYESIKGDPYYYDQPISARLSLHKGQKPFDVMLNVNMYEGVVEVYKEDKDVLIPFSQVLSIDSREHTSVLFLDNKMISFPYVGDDHKLSDEVSVTLQIKELYPPGAIIRKKKFLRKDRYILTQGGHTTKLKLSRRSIRRVLGKEALALADEHHLDVSKETGLVRLLQLMEIKA